MFDDIINSGSFNIMKCRAINEVNDFGLEGRHLHFDGNTPMVLQASNLDVRYGVLVVWMWYLRSGR